MSHAKFQPYPHSSHAPSAPTQPEAKKAAPVANLSAIPAPAPQAPEEAAGSTLIWQHWADLQRQQLALATECASALFRGIEAMRKTQQQAAQQASAHHASTAQKLRSPHDGPAPLQALLAPLQVDMEGAQIYWTQLTASALQAQTDMMHSLCQRFDSDNKDKGPSLQEVLQASLPLLAQNFFVNGVQGSVQ